MTIHTSASDASLPHRDEDELSPNVLIQLFSPIVTSQRVMNCQFGNSYSSVQSLDGTNMIFDEYMGYLFVHIGMRDVNWLKRMLGLCISIVKHLCGPDVSMLKSDKSLSSLLSRLLDTWVLLQDSDQAVLVEAVEQLMVNTDLSLTTLRTLQDATEKLKAGTDCAKIHAMVLVDNKFLSLYSSRSAQDLTASDTMFLSLLSESFHLVPPESSNMHDNATESEDSDEYYSPENTPQDSPTMLRKTEPAQEEYNSPVAVSNLESLLSVEKINSRATSPNPKSLLIENKLSFVNNEVIGGIRSYLVMLMGSGAAYNPHAVHIATLEEGVNLILMFETGNSPIALGLHNVLYYLNIIQNVQLQRDVEALKHSFDNLDLSMKKVLEIFRKNRPTKAEHQFCQSKLQSQWEFIRKKYIEYMKTLDTDCILRVESSTNYFVDTLKELLRFTCFDPGALLMGMTALLSAVEGVRHQLADFSEFLKPCPRLVLSLIMSTRSSLTINKYLEEFPGLVHFLYIDRTNHRVTAPSLDFSSKETMSLTKKKIWSMVDFSRSHLQEGHMAIMWKDTTFNYAYFLWFEDASVDKSATRGAGLLLDCLVDFAVCCSACCYAGRQAGSASGLASDEACHLQVMRLVKERAHERMLALLSTNMDSDDDFLDDNTLQAICKHYHMDITTSITDCTQIVVIVMPCHMTEICSLIGSLPEPAGEQARKPAAKPSVTSFSSRVPCSTQSKRSSNKSCTVCGRKLIETCFPKTSPSKVRCYELYCIHLGLATSSCVLEHSRRLAATIWEVTGVANNPLDIL
uniref:Hermansky-Pudlak syndrome 1 n=1 Tax=Timema shepardi TaxID=629360 RepID=A0A7R9G1N8_TIMSH|nr:unnamed protein product [Timema shepardi]